MEDRSLHDNIDAHRHAHRQRNEMLILAYILFGLLSLELHFLSSGFNFGNLLIILSLLTILALGTIKGALPFSLNFKLKSHDYTYLLYVSYIALTAYWSISYLDTAIAIIPAFCIFLISVLLGNVEIKLLIKCLLYFSLALAAMSFLLIFIDPELAYQPKSSTGVDELRGVFKHQLRLGAFMCVAAGLLILAVLNNMRSDVFFRNFILFLIGALLIFIALFLSRTRLYVLAAIISILLTVGLSKKGATRWITVAAIFYGSVLISIYYKEILSYLESIGFDTSLTARTLIWTRTIAAIKDEIYWIGYGYDSFINSNFDYLFSKNYRPAHAHNSFIQAHFETGMIGVILMSTVIISQFLSIISSRKCYKYSYALFIFIFCLLGSLFGLNYGGALSVLFCLLLIFLSIETRQHDIKK